MATNKTPILSGKILDQFLNGLKQLPNLFQKIGYEIEKQEQDKESQRVRFVLNIPGKQNSPFSKVQVTVSPADEEGKRCSLSFETESGRKYNDYFKNIPWTDDSVLKSADNFIKKVLLKENPEDEAEENFEENQSNIEFAVKVRLKKITSSSGVGLELTGIHAMTDLPAVTDALDAVLADPDMVDSVDDEACYEICDDGECYSLEECEMPADESLIQEAVDAILKCLVDADMSSNWFRASVGGSNVSKALDKIDCTQWKIGNSIQCWYTKARIMSVIPCISGEYSLCGQVDGQQVIASLAEFVNTYVGLLKTYRCNFPDEIKKFVDDETLSWEEASVFTFPEADVITY